MRKKPDLKVVGGKKKKGKGSGGGDGNNLSGSPLCCARKKNCGCKHRFARDERKKDHSLLERREPGFDQKRLGKCPECGRLRELCDKPRMKNRTVCATHGGKGGRKPLDPVVSGLDDDSIDAIAALQKAKDDSLENEFYAIKYFIQVVLGKFNKDDKGCLTFVERASALMDRAVGIQERRARLRLLVPPGRELEKVDFSDPRLALLLKEKMRQSYEDAVKGTLQVIVDSITPAGVEMLSQVLALLPERFQNYVAVEKAIPVKGEEIKADEAEVEEVGGAEDAEEKS